MKSKENQKKQPRPGSPRERSWNTPGRVLNASGTLGVRTNSFVGFLGKSLPRGPRHAIPRGIRRCKQITYPISGTLPTAPRCTLRAEMQSTHQFAVTGGLCRPQNTISQIGAKGFHRNQQLTPALNPIHHPEKANKKPISSQFKPIFGFLISSSGRIRHRPERCGTPGEGAVVN